MSFSKTALEVMAAHFILEGAGADAGDLYVVQSVDPNTFEKSVAVRWTASGFEFTACVAPVPADLDAFKAEWLSMIEARKRDYEGVKRLCDDTDIRARAVEVLAAVVFKRNQHASSR